ncbi:peptidase M23-like protein [Hypnocyclicus thermotrophus]|uniref:Peptidase M23-like protein n=1 Tax=Hypnocyclicus thermotrophus TaxID=1627895 RepID=A0AA46I5T6_9FUSO|nr:M23 family metallopeptidase [Hypnocyclicus thermotrophus]TDT69747.1 peptidase M23-like protein [Hypnocyclicus thermotrophus]
MKKVYFVLFSLIFISCSSVNQYNKTFDFGTDKGYKDLTILFDDGTDYYILDKKIKNSNTKIITSKNIKKEKENIKKDNINTTLSKDYTINNSTNLFYPLSNFKITRNFDKNGKKSIEIASSENKISASAPGMVIYSGENSNLGKAIFIYHNNGYISIYSHLTELKYKKGDYIRDVNTTIAIFNDTFEYELRKRTDKGVIAINPIEILKKK